VINFNNIYLHIFSYTPMIPILLMHTTILHLNFFYKGNFINRNQLHQDDIIYLRSFSDLYIAKMRKAVEENKKKKM
jgi:hypothetical protein